MNAQEQGLKQGQEESPAAFGQSITILYEDEFLLVVDKPRNMHVHGTKMSPGEISLQDILEEQLGQTLFPAHRLDRPAGGLLLIARSRETAGILGTALQRRDGLDKRYIAVVRGWMEGSGILERPLKQARRKREKESVTRWQALARAEAPWSDGIFPTSRYSLVECTLETGRFHQIRRHLSGASHPILGDISHGDNPRNRIWRDQTGLEGLMLRSHLLIFTHPLSGQRIRLTAPPDERFVRAASLLGWEENLVTE